MRVLEFVVILCCFFCEKISCLKANEPPSYVHRSCRNDDVACNRFGSACSVCIDITLTTTGCVSDFYDGLWYNSDCSLPKNCKLKCSKNSTCVNDIDYLPACLCPSGRYNALCQSTLASGHAIRMFQWSRKNMFGTPGSSEVIFKVVGKDTRTLVIKLTTGLGHETLVLGELGAIEDENCFYKSIPCSKISTQLRFPFIPFVNDYGVTVSTLHSVLRGYSSHVDVQVCTNYNGKCKSTVAYSYKVFVLYKPNGAECIAMISLQNCARSFKDHSKFVFHRNEEVVIEHEVKYLHNPIFYKVKESDDCAEDGTTWKWSWSKLTSFGFQEVQEKIEHTRIFDPFSLDLGTYRITLYVSRVIDGTKNENFGECYFDVKPLPVEVIIDGGETRTIMKSIGILLSAKQSYDPNEPSDEQGSLEMRWSCECLTKTIPHCEDTCNKYHGWMSIKRQFFLSGKDLQYNAEYKFIVHVSRDRGNTEQTDSVIIKVANENVTEVTNYEIVCIQNCIRDATFINEILFLKIKLSVNGGTLRNLNRSVEFDWEYSLGNETTLHPLDSMKLPNLPNSILALKENTFSVGTAYVIRMRIRNTQDYLAEYSFRTNSFSYSGKCSINPLSGISGITNFDIACNGSQGIMFEFYDKTDEEVAENIYFTGRLLGISEFLGYLNYVKVTRGNIVIYIIDKRSKLFSTQSLKVTISPLNITDKVIMEIKKNLSSLGHHDELTATMRYISSVTDIFSGDLNRGKILNVLLKAILHITPDTITHVKLSVKTLENVLQLLHKPMPLGVNVGLIGKILTLITTQADTILHLAKFRETSQWISSSELKLVSTGMLDCLSKVFHLQDATTTGHFAEQLGFDTLFTLRENAENSIKIVNKIKDILCYTQAPGLPPAKLATSDNFFQIWAIGNDEDNPVSEMLDLEKQIPFRPSQSILTTYDQIKNQYGRDLFFQVALFAENVFSWSKSDVKSKLVSLSVSVKGEDQVLNKIQHIDPPILVIISMDKNLTKTIVKGKAKQVNATANDLNMELTVHRIDTPPKRFVTIRFLFPPTNDSLRVLVMEDFRPDYELMIKSKDTVLINPSNPQYPLRNRANDVPVFLYMGILPGVNVTVNKTVEYEFEVSQHLCQRWIEGQWSSLGCTVSEVMASGETVCACNHLSIFAAAFPVPPQAIDPFGDARLFLTVLDNPIVVIFLILIFILYILVVLWGRNKDSIDYYKGKVIVLDDNFPGDPYAYLVAVHTSARFNSGTSAHVGIRLMGTSGNSRAHILSCERRKVLKRNTDDWFMVYTPKPLGDIYAIHLWHDNYGSNPDWYCDRIVVYDLKELNEFLFIVEQWLALREGDFPEIHVLIASDYDMLSLKRIFLDNTIIGFRESHVFLSVLVRHPRSEVTRVQRISVVMCSIMVAMLCSIMFYRPDNDNTSPSDDFHYTVGMRELIISLESTVITAFLTLIVFTSFHRSSRIEFRRLSTKIQYRRDQVNETMSEVAGLKQTRDENTLDKSFYENYVHYVSKYFKGEPLSPVYIWEGDKMAKINTIWYIISWTSCITVILVCAYLVMLYSLKLGFVKSQEWLSSLVMTMGEDTFVLGPARIFFVAILLSMAFQVSTKINIHGISFKDATNVRPHNDLIYLNILLAKRSHPMYAPLTTSARLALLRKMQVKQNWWQLIDFMNALFFVVVLSFVISRLWTSYFYNVDQLRTLFSKSRRTQFDSVDIEKINSMHLAENYMEVTYAEGLFNKWWYNGQLLSEYDNLEGIWKYWLLDFLNKPISKPHVRQVRVVPNDCQNPFMNMSECLLEWSLWNKDTNVYGVKWAPATYSDTIKDNPWKYEDLSTPLWWTNQRFYGVYGILYDVSGYDAFVGPTLQMAEKTLVELRENRWQDLYTRAFFATVTSYNVNVRTFSQVTVLFEYFVDGSMFGSVTVIPVTREILLGVWEFLFIVYASIYIFRGGYLINRMGLMNYLKKVPNVARLVVIFMACLAVIVWAMHHRNSIKYAEEFLEHMQDVHFDFDKFISLFSLLQVLLSLLYCLAIARTFMLLRGGRTCLNVYYTVYITLPFIVWFGVGLIFLIFVCTRLMYLLDCYDFFKVKELILPVKMMVFVSNETLQFHNVKAFILLRLVPMYFIHALFIIFFLHYSRVARVYNIKDSDSFNFAMFIMERVKKCFIKDKLTV